MQVHRYFIMVLFNVMKNTVVVYHKNCRDGIASAWVFYQKFGEDAEYIAAEYGNDVPEYITRHPDLSDTEIYFADFCYSKEVMLDLELKCKKLVVLDHHVSQKEAIESVKNHVYGTSESGCLLSWNYLFQNTEAPLAILYVSDSDTGQRVLPDHEYVRAYIYKSDNELTISDFDTTLKELSSKEMFEEVKKIGKVLREVNTGMINKYIEKAELITFAGYEVYAVNAPSEIKSELGHMLADKTNSFGVVYYYYGGKWRISLRSVKDFDVSLIAKEYGGGGHKNTAAISISASNLLLEIFNKKN